MGDRGGEAIEGEGTPRPAAHSGCSSNSSVVINWLILFREIFWWNGRTKSQTEVREEEKAGK